jgi:hypothetical protein
MHNICYHAFCGFSILLARCPARRRNAVLVARDAVGERHSTLGPFADSRRRRLALLERQRAQIDAVGHQQVERH